MKLFEEDKRGAIVRLPGPRGLSDLVQALEFFFLFVCLCVCVFFFLVVPSRAPEAGGEGWR